MPHLHLGVKITDLQEFQLILNENGFKPAEIEGDGWTRWGTKPGVEGNPADVLHVYVKVRGTKGAEELMPQLHRVVPLPDGVKGILTSSINWDEVISVYPTPLDPAQKEVSDAIETLYQYAVSLANECSGPTVNAIIEDADTARAVLRDAFNL